jgi:AcrR family transcriptional regulator
METLSGRDKRKERLRREILDAASGLFSQEGYDHVTMRRIADKVEYSQSSIYFYFRDKAEILTTICEEVFGALVERFDAICISESDPLARIVQASKSAIEFWLDHPHHFRTIFLGPSHQEGLPSTEVISKIGDPLFYRFAFMFHRFKHDGGEPDMDRPDPSALAWFSSLIGVTLFLIMNAEAPWLDRQEVIHHNLELLSNGLRSTTNQT